MRSLRPRKVGAESKFPDDFQCRRSDGRGWRCLFRARPNGTLCKKHFQKRLLYLKQSATLNGGKKRQLKTPMVKEIALPRKNKRNSSAKIVDVQEERKTPELESVAELRKIKQEMQIQRRKDIEEHLKRTKELECRKNEIEERLKELEQQAARNDYEKKKMKEEKKRAYISKVDLKRTTVYSLKENLQRSNKLQRSQEEKQRMLIEKHEKQKRDLCIELHQAKMLADRQKLELEHLEGLIETMKQVKDGSCLDHYKNIEDIQNNLKDKTDEMESLQDMNKLLMNKERRANDELQDARKTVIKILDANSTAANSEVIIKRMGVLAEQPWKDACMKKYKVGWVEKYCELHSLWMDHINNPSWYPFKVVENAHGHEYLVDENDEMLRNLRNELGEEVCRSVVEALEEMMEYNGSGRYPVPELWHAKEKRQATLTEAILYLYRTSKRKRVARS